MSVMVQEDYLDEDKAKSPDQVKTLHPPANNDFLAHSKIEIVWKRHFRLYYFHISLFYMVLSSLCFQLH